MILVFFFWCAYVNVKTMSFYYYYFESYKGSYLHLTVTQGKLTLHAAACF